MSTPISAQRSALSPSVARLRAARRRARRAAAHRLPRNGRPRRSAMLRLLVAIVALAWVGLATFSPGSNAEAMEAAAASYRVAPGDTLFSIANRSGMTVSDLARLNGISDPDFIIVGQVLQLNAAIATPARKYTIQPGDTLGAIALATGAAPEEIATLNGLFNHDRIIAGAVLDLPAGGSSTSAPSSSRGAAAGFVWKGSPNFWPGRPQGAPI